MRTVTVIAIASTLLVSCTEQETEPDAAEEPTFSQFTSLEGSERDAAWSPDGQWVVFGGGPGSQLDLWKMPASGGGEVIQLTSGPAMDVFPAWSPDGTQIAFSSNREGSINLWTVPAAGGEPTRITADEDSVTSKSKFCGMSSVDWSPDGTQLAFSASKTGNNDIWIIPVSGGGPARQLTSGPADDGNPEWSPDGTQISFSSNRSGNVDIWIIPALGGFPRQVTDHPSNDWWNSWSPDGRWLAFVSERSGNYDI